MRVRIRIVRSRRGFWTINWSPFVIVVAIVIVLYIDLFMKK